MLAGRPLAIPPSEATGESYSSPICPRLFCRQQILIDLFGDHFAEDRARLDALQADIGVDRSLHAAVREQLSQQFIFTGPMFEDDGAGSMPELVHRYPQSGCLVNSISDLAAEADFLLGAASLSRE